MRSYAGADGKLAGVEFQIGAQSVRQNFRDGTWQTLEVNEGEISWKPTFETAVASMQRAAAQSNEDKRIANERVSLGDLRKLAGRIT